LVLHLLARDRRAHGGSDGHPNGKLRLDPLDGGKRIEFFLAPAREGDGSRYVFSEIPAGEYRLSLIEEISSAPLPLVHPVETVSITSHEPSEHQVDVRTFGDLEIDFGSSEMEGAATQGPISLLVAGARGNERRGEDEIVGGHWIDGTATNARVPAIPPGRYFIVLMGEGGLRTKRWVDVSDALGWRVDLNETPRSH